MTWKEFGRGEEKNDSKPNRVEAVGIMITENEEGTNEAGRKQFMNNFQNMNNG